MSRILIALIEKRSMVVFIYHAVGKAQFSLCSLKHRSPTPSPRPGAGNWDAQAVGECKRAKLHLNKRHACVQNHPLFPFLPPVRRAR